MSINIYRILIQRLSRAVRFKNSRFLSILNNKVSFNHNNNNNKIFGMYQLYL